MVRVKLVPGVLEGRGLSIEVQQWVDATCQYRIPGSDFLSHSGGREEVMQFHAFFPSLFSLAQSQAEVLVERSSPKDHQHSTARLASSSCGGEQKEAQHNAARRISIAQRRDSSRA